MNSIYYSDNLIVEGYADISNLINVFNTTDTYLCYLYFIIIKPGKHIANITVNNALLYFFTYILL